MNTRRSLLGAAGLLLCAPAAVRARATPAAEAAGPLARPAPPGLDPAGWLVSEKYDGVRAHWDGRQLRSRSGRPIPAPSGWLAGLPLEALDGELWLGRGRFEAVSALVHRSAAPEADWAELRYMVFELPGGAGGFGERAARLQRLAAGAGPWQAVPQQTVADAAALQRRLAEVVAGGGEGLVLHQVDAPWQTGRGAALLKLKPEQDDEAVVVAHLPGRGRLAGQLGALRVRDALGRSFLIGSGFTDAQRRSPPPLGSTVSYRWRGRTDHGLPRHATFWRLRPPE